MLIAETVKNEIGYASGEPPGLLPCDRDSIPSGTSIFRR